MVTIARQIKVTPKANCHEEGLFLKFLSTVVIKIPEA